MFLQQTIPLYSLTDTDIYLRAAQSSVSSSMSRVTNLMMILPMISTIKAPSSPQTAPLKPSSQKFLTWQFGGLDWRRCQALLTALIANMLSSDTSARVMLEDRGYQDELKRSPNLSVWLALITIRNIRSSTSSIRTNFKGTEAWNVE